MKSLFTSTFVNTGMQSSPFQLISGMKETRYSVFSLFFLSPRGKTNSQSLPAASPVYLWSTSEAWFFQVSRRMPHSRLGDKIAHSNA